MIFSVSNDGIDWSFDFGPDSVTLTVKHLAQEMTKFPRNSFGSLELVLASKTKVLEQPSSASSSYPQPTGTHEMKDELLSSVGAQEGLDTSGYQVSSADVDGVEFYREK